ncbi:MAG: hypothetical protein LUM44_04745 [Pyrinomonadaceae bacterium]|nr:hypothetical protein [Pyrinomonadaceae bacterium]
MPKPVINGGVSAQLGINTKGAEAGLGVRVSVKLSAKQNQGAIRQVSQQVIKNPNHNRANTTHQTQNQPQVRQNHGGHEQGQPANLKNSQNQGNNGANHASEQGLEHGRGHHKSDVDTPNQPHQPNNTNNTNTANTPKPQNPPTQTNTEKPQNLPNTPNTPNLPHQHFPQTNSPHQPTTQHFPTVRINIPANVPQLENLPNALLKIVLGPILQQNDIYLSNRAINQLIDGNSPNYHSNSQSNPLPKQIGTLLQNVGKTLFGFVQNPSNLSGKMIHQVTTELAHHFHEEIQASKTILLNTAGLDGKHFEQLNIRERMQTAVELLPRHIPAHAMETLQNHPSHEILNGFLLARGFVSANENAPNTKTLAALTNVLANEIPPAALRDIGQLVKILIADAASAKTTANLDLAVQKFVRILLANNELGVLLAVISLAGQTQPNGGLVSRSLALAQIYEMINRLILAGEKAMNEAMPKNVSESVLQKSEKNNFISLSVNTADKDDANPNINKPGQTGAESALRQFLEFNPAFMQDNSASAFTNSDDARQAQKDFVSAYQTEIEQWLRSGNHRLVKDIDFEKPIGIVVERDSEGYFSATKARIVLVRDSSVVGWHFLKSFLVS